MSIWLSLLLSFLFHSPLFHVILMDRRTFWLKPAFVWTFLNWALKSLFLISESFQLIKKKIPSYPIAWLNDSQILYNWIHLIYTLFCYRLLFLPIPIERSFLNNCWGNSNHHLLLTASFFFYVYRPNHLFTAESK